MEVKKLALAELRWGLTTETAQIGPDEEYDPIIVERVGNYYDVIDGHHRVEGIKAAGGKDINAIIVTEDECADADFAGGDTPEDEWIDNIQRRAIP